MAIPSGLSQRVTISVIQQKIQGSSPCVVKDVLVRPVPPHGLMDKASASGRRSFFLPLVRTAGTIVFFARSFLPLSRRTPGSRLGPTGPALSS